MKLLENKNVHVTEWLMPMTYLIFWHREVGFFSTCGQWIRQGPGTCWHCCRSGLGERHGGEVTLWNLCFSSMNPACNQLPFPWQGSSTFSYLKQRGKFGKLKVAEEHCRVGSLLTCWVSHWALRSSLDTGLPADTQVCSQHHEVPMDREPPRTSWIPQWGFPLLCLFLQPPLSIPSSVVLPCRSFYHFFQPCVIFLGYLSPCASSLCHIYSYKSAISHFYPNWCITDHLEPVMSVSFHHTQAELFSQPPSAEAYRPVWL